MVGAPKHLYDLNKIEADVRVTCRQCGFEVDWTVADLSAHLLAIGGNLTWSEITRHLSCRRQGCGSHRLRASVVPYGRRQANLPRRIGRLEARLVSFAMKVLDEATFRSPGTDVATTEVRLALTVVYIYVRDADLVREFWVRAGQSFRTSGNSLREKTDQVRHRLIQAGVLSEPEVIERVPYWPWSSPAPPGWYDAAERHGSSEAKTAKSENDNGVS